MGVRVVHLIGVSCGGGVGFDRCKLWGRGGRGLASATYVGNVYSEV